MQSGYPAFFFSTDQVPRSIFVCSFLTGHTAIGLVTTFEPPHDKTYKMACAASEDSDQPGNRPRLI